MRLGVVELIILTPKHLSKPKRYQVTLAEVCCRLDQSIGLAGKFIVCCSECRCLLHTVSEPSPTIEILSFEVLGRLHIKRDSLDISLGSNIIIGNFLNISR